ncbi:MAG: delta-lactam-biosynthetic de-N-acetylase [Clostridium sp.]|uniref:delta-lactam-biosynthetic de-N-acetylase n=1 Tax=Clostridium sp. TaxID=1506 RepID=UPI003F3126D5
MKNKKLFLIGLSLILFIIFIPVKYVFSHSNSEHSWYFMPNGKAAPPSPPRETENFLAHNNAYFLGNSSSKDIFLTFDEGYENGNTNKILDILKETNTPAAFFVVKPYIEKEPALINRMISEGHLVCNHSSKHLSMPSLDYNTFTKEFKEVEDSYKALTGKDIPKFFRPPMGKYSEDSLIKTKNLGYKTIFWSFAYKDWLINAQPSPEEGFKKITSSVHPGCILLLHAVSDTNVKILKDVIIHLQKEGYTFKPLTDL